MLRSVFAAVAVVSITSAAMISGAMAADLPARSPAVAPAPVQAPAPVYNWDGFYLGMTAGAAFLSSKHTSAGQANPGGISLNKTGFLVGGTAGYNAQFGMMVLGAEGDLSWASAKGSVNSAGVQCLASCQTQLNWFGTLRARLGYNGGMFMPYLTGGVAFGGIKATDTGLGTAALAGSVAETASSTRIGWTLGVGVEAKFAPQWSAKLEYLYSDLGNVSYGNATNIGAGFARTRVTSKVNVFRLGVNYHFVTR